MDFDQDVAGAHGAGEGPRAQAPAATLRVPDLIAHRGYPRRFPENTLEAVGDALAAGARYVEIDVQLSADHVPVLFHDATLARLCGVAGAVRDFSLAALGGLRVRAAPGAGPVADADGAGEAPACAMPTLAAVVELFAAHPAATLFVEVKREALAAFGNDVVYRRVAGVLAPLRERAVLISFEADFLRTAQERGWARLGGVVADWDARERLHALAPGWLFAAVDHLPPHGRLEWPHGRLAVYEVADPALALRLAARGVDLVETFAFGAMHAALGGG